MSAPLIANLLGRRRIVTTPGVVMAGLRERFEDVPVELFMPEIEGKRGFGLLVDGIHVIPVFEDVALDLDGLKPWLGHLQDAEGPLLDNVAHVMIGTPPGFEGHGPTLRASMAVLRVASILSEQTGVHAVLWSPAEALTAAPAFRAEVAQASQDHAAVGVLTRMGQFQAGQQDGKPMIGVWAMGLSRFIGREIEFVPKPLPLYAMLNALTSAANWLLLKGSVFKDRDTFGISETERIRVHHRDRGLMVETPVLLMDIETLDPGATRFAH